MKRSQRGAIRKAPSAISWVVSLTNMAAGTKNLDPAQIIKAWRLGLYFLFVFFAFLLDELTWLFVKLAFSLKQGIQWLLAVTSLLVPRAWQLQTSFNCFKTAEIASLNASVSMGGKVSWTWPIRKLFDYCCEQLHLLNSARLWFLRLSIHWRCAPVQEVADQFQSQVRSFTKRITVADSLEEHISELPIDLWDGEHPVGKFESNGSTQTS